MEDRRSRDISLASHSIWYYMRSNLDLSYPEIARAVQRDHSAIVHGVTKIAGLLREAGAHADRARGFIGKMESLDVGDLYL